MKNVLRVVITLFLLGVLLSVSGTVYIVTETEQVVVTQFGRPVGEPVTTAGLKFKLPFIRKVNRFDKRVLEWDGPPNDMLTKDKTFIVVDTFGRWQITDPLKYFLRLTDERRALSRLDDILGSATLTTVANHDLVEVVRTTKDREPPRDESVAKAKDAATLKPISKGRVKLEEEIFTAAAKQMEDLGITLLDVRFKRVNYHPSVAGKIHARMISERQQIAAGFRSEGAGEAARIIGQKEKELKRINSEAYKTVEQLRGEADAKATTIYAEAYNQSPDAAKFYEFMQTMSLYKEALAKDTSVILSTDSELFQFLKGAEVGGARAPE
jgi:membrane protease subunit HflC